MNIQIVTQYFFPDNFRFNDVAKELVLQGHKVNVLTGLPDYEKGHPPEKYKKLQNRKEEYCGVEILRATTISRRTGVFFRVLNYLSFVVSVGAKAICTKLQPDAIIVHQPGPILQAIPAMIIRKKTGAKVVLYGMDLWPESMKAWNVAEKNIAFKIMHHVSGWIYNKCDTVAITSSPFKEYLQKEFNVPSDKIVYLPQYAEDEYSDIACSYIENHCIDFLFAGNLGSVQNIDCILNAASLIDTNINFCVHIVGDGSEFENLKEMSQKLSLGERVVFHGRFPSEKMKDFYKMADCFLLTLRSGNFIGKTLPGKAQSYLSAGKPIVGAIDGAGNEVIKEADCGIAVSAGDEKALAAAMTEILENFDIYKDKGANGRKYYLENFTKDIFMDGLLELL